MKKPQHISNEVLARFLDDECSGAETAAVERHLAVCPECKQKYNDLGVLSRSVEDFIGAIAPKYAQNERDALVLLLNTESRHFPRPSEKILQRLAWGMALAASLAVGLVLIPELKHPQAKTPGTVQDIQQTGSLLEVDGETFVPLPYSNPDLPMTAHIVQMQVPVSSLADAGVHFEAISNEVSGSNDSVLADVLLGIDGQPLGVHVLNPE